MSAPSLVLSLHLMPDPAEKTGQKRPRQMAQSSLQDLWVTP